MNMKCLYKWNIRLFMKHMSLQNAIRRRQKKQVMKTIYGKLGTGLTVLANRECFPFYTDHCDVNGNE